MKIKSLLHHSTKMIKILNESDPYVGIRTITHSNPVMIFWVSPDGEVIEASNSHHQNPPNDDRSILSDKINKGYLRGRSAIIGDILYIVVYGDDNKELSVRQFSLLRRSYIRILSKLKDKIGIRADNHLFINENGDIINL